ncbi:MAG: ATP-binding cassette domain-containing protein [Collinsella sp.]
MELIVKAKDIFLEYAGRDILDIEELEIYSYDRIGLVGDNGAGKTSLLKILSGNLTIADADVRRFGSIALIGQLDELTLMRLRTVVRCSPVSTSPEWRRRR